MTNKGKMTGQKTQNATHERRNPEKTIKKDHDESGFAGLVSQTIPQSLSMIMEDISKHFSQELNDKGSGGEHPGARGDDGGTEERMELATGMVDKGFIGLTDIASISTLGNVSRPHGRRLQSNATRSTTGSKMFKGVDTETNLPHPLLEFPPLYWILKPYPRVIEFITSMYKFRWHVSYPLQKRVIFSQTLRKLNIHMTWGELILVVPLLLTIVGGIVTSVVYPSAKLSGHAARLALIFALITPIRNSLLTLLIGLPFERALWYHKLAGRLAFAIGILHTYAAHAESVQKAFFEFIMIDVMNASGTGLMLLILTVTITSVPQIRRWCFEVFYYVHLVCVAMMTACAFYHSGILIPILATLWLGDLICRKVVMACYRYPRKARIRVISDTVLELRFPKCNFDYNPGQHVCIAVPQLDLTFHPFSIATCPRMSYVSVLIRKAGTWTSALHEMAREQMEVSILLEGPNGSPNCNIFDPKRYQSVLLLSGGIGVTPIQSICNQLIYEHSKGLRDLKKMRVVWTDRDPVLVNRVDMVRRNSSHQLQIPNDRDEESQPHDLQSLATGSIYWDADSYATAIASALLTHFPPSDEPGPDLGQECTLDGPVAPRQSRKKRAVSAAAEATRSDESTFRAAFENPSIHEILELQVYLTSQQRQNTMPSELSNLSFIHSGRPNIPKILADMREEALEMGLTRVAVFLCAPARLALICQNACVKFSDDRFQFDFHMEYQE